MTPRGVLYIGRGYHVFRSKDMGTTWESLGRIPGRVSRRIAGRFRMAARLLRFEIKALVELGDDHLVASVREGLYFYENGKWTQATVSPVDGRPARSPMRIMATPQGEVVWGEYGRNMERSSVAVYRSRDGGRSYAPLHVFSPGDIRHIHSVIPHGSGTGYWVMTGDYGNEPGIGILAQDGADLQWLGRGEQRYRAVHVFDHNGSLVYGTDTEEESNRIIHLDQKSGEVQELQELPGSCLHGCRFGDVLALSTSVEASPVNQGRNAELWVSRDALKWERVCERQKDRWHALAFQFGSLILPSGSGPKGPVVFSAQSLEGWDHQVFQIHA